MRAHNPADIRNMRIFIFHCHTGLSIEVEIQNFCWFNMKYFRQNVNAWGSIFIISDFMISTVNTLTKINQGYIWHESNRPASSHDYISSTQQPSGEIYLMRINQYFTKYSEVLIDN